MDFTLDELEDAWNKRLLDIPVSKINLLYELSHDYKMYLLSNTNDIHLSYILKYIQSNFKKDVFSEVFKFCFYSQRLNLVKPNPDIYIKVLEQDKLNPKETLFIDDSYANIQAAASMEIKTIHYQNEVQLKRELAQIHCC